MKKDKEQQRINRMNDRIRIRNQNSLALDSILKEAKAVQIQRKARVMPEEPIKYHKNEVRG